MWENPLCLIFIYLFDWLIDWLIYLFIYLFIYLLLQLCLSTERHSHAFMVKIRDFYHSERLYLLQCIHHILTYWSDSENHPYRVCYLNLNIIFALMCRKPTAHLNHAWDRVLILLPPGSNCYMCYMWRNIIMF